jgi:hypothetical protein
MFRNERGSDQGGGETNGNGGVRTGTPAVKREEKISQDGSVSTIYSFEVQLQSISMPSSIHPSIRHFNGQVATGCSREEISLANETNETNEARPGWGQPASQPNSAN